ncbi:MAG: 2-phosphosulfolactate phosphatase [Candidatus Limnocylindrales bacterium]|jgi:2-phosphosulfolactate phosphatase
MDVDVALVPQVSRPADPAVFIVVDEIRASTTMTTLLDLGCSNIYIEGALTAARRRGRETGSILVGERHLRRPAGFDFANSPLVLARAGVQGRSVVLSTTNGTAMLKMLRRSGHVLVGCLRNARACGGAAVRLAEAQGVGIRVVCAGRLRRFVLEDAVAAGVIVTRIVEAAEARGIDTDLTDAARLAVGLRDRYPDILAALLDSDGARTLRKIGEEEDVPFCAEVDVTDAVPILRDGSPMRIERLQP